MRWMNIILVIILAMVLVSVVSIYVYLGTYVFPIAPHWVTQLPPNPPQPKIKYREVSFKLEYEISGETKVIKDILICEFEGFKVYAVGGSKIRKWNDYYKNEQGNEIFTFRNEPSRDRKSTRLNSSH